MATSRIISFLALAFGISWSIAGVAAWRGVDTTHASYVIVAALCMLGPALAAILQWRSIDRAGWSALGLHPKRINWRFVLLTVVVGACIIPMCLLVSYVFSEVMHLPGYGHVEVSSAQFTEAVEAMLEGRDMAAPSAAMQRIGELPGVLLLLVMLVGAAFTALTVNLPFMLGEELGWRGYLFAATAHWSAARRVALTGPVWGIWHAPLILMGHNYPGHPLTGILLMVVFCTVLSVLFDMVRVRVASVWGPSVLHGMINGSAGAFMLFAWDGHVLLASPAGVAGVLALLTICATAMAFDTTYRRSFFTPTSLA